MHLDLKRVLINGFLGALFAATLVGWYTLPCKFSVYFVVSDSMLPALKQDDLIFVCQKAQYEIGDIITYRHKNNPSLLITHRIVEIQVIEDQAFYITKGDNNTFSDFELVSVSEVVGEVVFVLGLAHLIISPPYLGILVYGFFGYFIGIYLCNLISLNHVKDAAP
jgi:signal peptidase I